LTSSGNPTYVPDNVVAQYADKGEKNSEDILATDEPVHLDLDLPTTKQGDRE
jgi:hypothetical protein